ncbi:MAG: glycerate kinase [Thermodesulfobacteriota bacterium]|nr:glycerate kinase [Thermodesulfobacteriota bacterium]
MASRRIVDMRRDIITMYRAGLEAVEPGAAVRRHCRLDNNRLMVDDFAYNLDLFENVFVIGAGKAAAPMAKALEKILGNRLKGGVINVKYGHLDEVKKVLIHEAGHPVPDQAGMEGARDIFALAQRASATDLVICVVSGGGSALLPMPVPEVTLEEKQKTTQVLLECGATIHEINAVRKHISSVKGGRLAQAVYPATLVSLILSDVIGDDLDVIASGQTAPDSSTFQDCLTIFDRYDIRNKLPESVLQYIVKGVEGSKPETPKPGDPIFEKTRNLIIGNNLQCVLAAQKTAQDLGYNTLVLSTLIEGETKEVAKVHAAIAKEISKSGMPVQRPACVLSGGETTVKIRGGGLGGRNQEFALAFGLEIAGWDGIVALSIGTDGTDGPTDAAGAITDGTMLTRAAELGLDPRLFLSDNDSYHFFEPLGDLVRTGPTKTNVMDLRLVLIDGET